MLEYTIEFLAQNGVEEVYFLTILHAFFLQECLDLITFWLDHSLLRLAC